MPEADAAAWQFYCEPATFDALRTNPAFHRLLELARHVNALRYAVSASAAVIGDNSPNGDRQRFGTFYYLGGVLFEAFDLLPKLRPHFENTEAWRQGFARYGTDQEIRHRIRQGGDLHRLRNHTSFHFLEIVSAKSLAKLQFAEYTFTSGLGRQNGFVYHNLADAVGLHYLAGSPADGDLFDERAVRLATESRDLALEYLSCASKLIGQAIKGFGFKRRGTMSRLPPNDR